MSPDPAPVTKLLQLAQAGDADAREQLFERVYQELRNIAIGHVARTGGARTLQPTALVHEAYLRLVELEDASFASRRHFYALASRVMRGLLVDHARARAARKRSGGSDPAIPPESVTRVACCPDGAVGLLDFGLALEDLASIDGELAKVAELRYLAGLEVAEVAAVMNIAVRTTERRLQVANSWLRTRLDAG